MLISGISQGFFGSITLLWSVKRYFTAGWTNYEMLAIFGNVLGSFGSAQVWNHWLQEAGTTRMGTGACYHAGSQGNCRLVCAGRSPSCYSAGKQ